MKIIEKEFNAITGKETIFEREMTDDELKQFEIDQKEIALRLKKESEKEIAKTALLAKLGITEDEAKLLLS